MEWRPVVGYEGYYIVNEIGDVWSVDRMVDSKKGDTKYQRFVKGRELKHNDSVWGYHDVVLNMNGLSKHRFVHRIVAEAFIDNPEGYSIVNHKDGDKTNNKVDNLEWCDASYNAKHSFDSPGRTEENHRKSNLYTFKPTCAENVHTGEILEFDSIRACARYFNVSKCLIQNRLSGATKNPSYSGMTCLDGWRFYRVKNKAEIPKIVQLDKEMNFIAEFKNIHQASVNTGINGSTINCVVRGVKGYNTAGGYIWMKKSDYEDIIDKNSEVMN